MKEAKKQGGFTIIEVSIAMVFVATIITLLAATTVNIVQSYNKGIWLAQINQAGQQLNSDFGDKVRYSGIASVPVDENDESVRRICVGNISYLWNTESDIDKGNLGDNQYSEGGSFKMLRINDPGGEYCKQDDSGHYKKPSKSDSNVRVLLGRGVSIQEFDVIQGVYYKDANDGNKEKNDTNIPLLRISAVISTSGSNRPILAYTNDLGETKIDPSMWSDSAKRDNSHWQCGDWIDNDTKGEVDENDTFTPAKAQFCSFAQYDITVYERSQE